MNLYQKIVEVRKTVDGFNKDKEGYGYDYVSGNQILSKIKEKMNELNLLLIPSASLGEHHTHDYTTNKGREITDFVVSGKMSYTWINGDEPTEREIIEWVYYGQQDDISKAFGSALTYSERYFLLKCLGLPTDELDPDSKETNNKYPSSAKNAQTGVTEKQLNRLYAIAKSKNVNANTAAGHIALKYQKAPELLTREEYDIVCKGYEEMEIKK